MAHYLVALAGCGNPCARVTIGDCTNISAEPPGRRTPAKLASGAPHTDPCARAHVTMYDGQGTPNAHGNTPAPHYGAAANTVRRPHHHRTRARTHAHHGSPPRTCAEATCPRAAFRVTPGTAPLAHPTQNPHSPFATRNMPSTTSTVLLAQPTENPPPSRSQTGDAFNSTPMSSPSRLVYTAASARASSMSESAVRNRRAKARWPLHQHAHHTSSLCNACTSSARASHVLPMRSLAAYPLAEKSWPQQETTPGQRSAFHCTQHGLSGKVNIHVHDLCTRTQHQPKQWRPALPHTRYTRPTTGRVCSGPAPRKASVLLRIAVARSTRDTHTNSHALQRHICSARQAMRKTSSHRHRQHGSYDK